MERTFEEKVGLRGEGWWPSRKRLVAFAKKAGGLREEGMGLHEEGQRLRGEGQRLHGEGQGLLRTQQRLDSVSVLGEASFIINCLYLCLSFSKGHTLKGVGLRVADSHTSNHRKDGFTPLETFGGFPIAFGV
ncbi:hypothetical protein Tco_0290436 [Tanacetum coccineum]